MNRRRFLGTLGGLAAAPALVGLSCKSDSRIAGGFVDDGGAVGHRIRDHLASGAAAPRDRRRVSVAIVGGGMAGLSAAWELERRGLRDFVVLELERAAGGNARSGENDVSAYPWAAHYVPVPGVRATLVRELFEELGVLKDGVWDERHLCFAPQERLFLDGEWHGGLEPTYALDARGREEFQRFASLVDDSRRGGEFTIPMELGARRDSPLDRTSFAAWLDAREFRHPALRWYLDYACRDDYGALARDTSAWAGIHYFASREPEEKGPLTWPEGNGWIAKRLLAKLGGCVETGAPVYRIERTGARWQVLTPRTAWDADAVIFAAPTFLAPYLVPELSDWRPARVYSPWLTANLTVERWPREIGVDPAWDNVIYDSPALGYVVATHQSLRTHIERTVWTYYWSFAEMRPADARRMLLAHDWGYWRDRIVADLARAHPDIARCVSRIDVMRLGHAMVRPVPGFLAGARPPRELPRLHFAHSDQSGLSLFEEAQSNGVGAARRALSEVGSSAAARKG